MRKKRILLSLVFALFFAVCGDAATIIYKTTDGKQKIISKVKILTINGDLITLKIGQGTRNISRKALLKYYDENISTDEFEDNTVEYKVSLSGDPDFPQSGIVGNHKKKTVATVKFHYSISPQGTGKIRMPYFYLFVLTTGNGEYGNRKMYVYQYPEKEAKLSSKNGYNEAKMLEKALSATRPFLYENRDFSSRNLNRDATFKLSGIENRRILAWHLVVWGKDGIIATRDHSKIEAQISKQWWLHYQNK